MNRRVPFLCVACTRLLARQGPPFVNEYPERQHYQGLAAQCMCVYVITCPSTCLQGEDASPGADREGETEECLLATAAGVSVVLFLLCVIMLCACTGACVCCICDRSN